MPAILTHFTFSDKYMRDEVKPYQKAVNLGSQGPDAFFFYGFRLRGKRLRPNKKGIQEFGHDIHHSDISDIYYHFFDYANTSKKKYMLYAYIEGLFLHYCLDRNCHGFIFSKAGDNLGDASDGVNWNARHIAYEGMIDYLIGKKFHTYTHRTWRFVSLKRDDLLEISRMWKYVNDKVSETPDFAEKTFYLSIKDLRFVRHMIDGLGPLSGAFVGTLAGKISAPYGLHIVSSFPKRFEGMDFLNEQRNAWLDPYDGNERNECFSDLFERSISDYEKAIKIIEKAKTNLDVRKDLKEFVGNWDHESSKDNKPRCFRSPIWKDLD